VCPLYRLVPSLTVCPLYQTGSTMVSYVWGLIQFGSLVSACFVGPLADAYDPKIIFWFCVPLAASIVIPTGLGYLGDPKVAPILAQPLTCPPLSLSISHSPQFSTIVGIMLFISSFAPGMMGVD